ncbi:MAG: glycosyltransferase family 2 protein [Clostridia bacterium]|nr:glycosyltransferase family 2 protein [Clostridia bacterium]
MQEPVLYLIIPCYNEEKVILTTAEIVTQKLDAFIASGSVSPQSRILLVDDGSTDRTWELLLQLYNTNDKIAVLRHNRNYGEQHAYLSGIRYASTRADCMITMDADLQDDIDATDAMLDAYFQGCDVVYGVRRSRDTDRLFQKATSSLFYHTMRLCGTKLVREHSQYRLMSRTAAQAILEHMELNIFLPALVPLLHLRERIVYYDRKPRAAGESHYNVRSLSRMASNAILSYGTYLPRFLLAFAIADLLIGGFAAWFGFAGEHTRAWYAVAAACFAGTVLFVLLFFASKAAQRRHLSAKNRPNAKDAVISEVKE